MIKLYNSINNKLYYWETWETEEKSAIIHWGLVGEEGDYKEVKGSFFSNFKKKVDKELTQKIGEGYEAFDEDNYTALIIEYRFDSEFVRENLDKRHRLEDLLEEFLDTTCLGSVDGGGIGETFMDVCCLVVDFGIAKKAIENKLKNTEFADYTKIVKEGED